MRLSHVKRADLPGILGRKVRLDHQEFLVVAVSLVEAHVLVRGEKHGPVPEWMVVIEHPSDGHRHMVSELNADLAARLEVLE